MRRPLPWGNAIFSAPFIPKLWTVLREDYGKAKLKGDVSAGLTVAVVALPLSMAIAIASGVTPDRGLYAAIVGGLIVSALGGSRFQIGGPAGAFIVLVAATVKTHGLDGLIAATMLSGAIMVASGYLQLGSIIRFMPFPVTVGFTAAVAIVIFTSQIKDLLGLTLVAPEPGPLLAKIVALCDALPSLSVPALIVSVLTIAIISLCRKFRPHWPGMLIAVTLASLVSHAAHLPLETIGSRFGGISQMLPRLVLPAMSLDLIVAIFPAALSFALLGSIESLLSATVADSMTAARHRSNAELAAQGFANIFSALFGGICVTGTIARTAANIRAGASGPLAGVLHSLFLLFALVYAYCSAACCFRSARRSCRGAYSCVLDDGGTARFCALAAQLSQRRGGPSDCVPAHGFS